MPTPSLIIPSAPVYDEGLLYGLNVYGTNFVPEPIPFTRATTATRTNAAGLIELAPYNIVQYSEMFADSWWVKTGSSITANTITAPNGTLTADTIIENTSTGDHKVFKVIPLPSGNTYTLSIYAKKKERNLIYLFDAYTARGTIFNLDTSATTSIGAGLINANIVSVGDGWYRCSGSVTIAISGNYSFEAGITNSTSSASYAGDGTSGAYIWGAQLVEGTSALPYLKTETRLNRPRVDFSLGGCPNLLLEPQRTNLAPQSSSFDSLSWAKASSSVTANTTSSPGGIVDADTLNSTTTSASIVAQAVTIVSGTTYTLSFYIKQNTQRFVYIRFTSNTTPNNYVSVVFDLQDGTVGQTSLGATSGTLVSATTQSAANGFYRLNLTASINITDGNIGVGFATAKTGNTFNTSGTITSAITNGNSFFVWGAQLEAGAYPTTYIPTTTTSVTRNADSFVESNVFSRGMITAAGGTWFLELRNNRVLVRDTIANGNALFISDSAVLFTTNSICIHNPMNTSEFIAVFLRNNSVSQTIYTTNAANIKLAIKWNGATIDVFANGVKVVSNHPFAATLLNFLNGGGGDVPKYIQQMELYPTPLSDGELISMTTL